MKIATFPITEEFQLKTDPDEEARVYIRQAREGENTAREDMFSKTTRIFENPEIGTVAFDGSVKLQSDQNPAKIRRKEAFLVMGKVIGITDEKGNELFRSEESIDGPSVRAGMSETEFNRVWNRLPPEVAKEISEYIWKVNPTWDQDRLGE
jgi:hypothetical protein